MLENICPQLRQPLASVGGCGWGTLLPPQCPAGSSCLAAFSAGLKGKQAGSRLAWPSPALCFPCFLSGCPLKALLVTSTRLSLFQGSCPRLHRTLLAQSQRAQAHRHKIALVTIRPFAHGFFADLWLFACLTGLIKGPELSSNPFFKKKKIELVQVSLPESHVTLTTATGNTGLTYQGFGNKTLC